MLRKLLRPFAQSPSYCLTVIATLMLGFGATAALLTVVHSLVLKPLPFGRYAELVYVPSVNADATGKLNEYTTSVTNLLDLRERQQVFQSMAGLELNEMGLTDGSEPRLVDMGRITANLFETLAVRPHRGRFFVPEEESAASRVVILSHALWMQAFGGVDDLSQQKITLDGIPHQVVGVAPPGFKLVAPAQLWIPMNLAIPRSPRSMSGGISVIARRKPGVNLDAATRDMARVAADLAKEFPDTNTGWSAKVVDVREFDTRQIRPVLWILTAGVFLLLIISCVNAAHILLSRALAREPEVAVRIALGAGKKQLFLELFGEYLILTITALMLGLLIALITIGPIARLSPLHASNYSSFQILADLSFSLPIPVFMLLLAVAISATFSLISLSTIRLSSLTSVLKSDGRQATGSVKGKRLRNLMVASEIAMSCFLLTAAGWVTQCFWKLDRIHPGFEVSERLTFKFSLPASRYETHEKRALFLRQARERLLSVPGLKAVGASTRLPLNEFAFTTFFNLEGRPPERIGDGLISNFRRITPAYFRSAGIRLLEGRDFEDSDADQTMPIAIVSREFANRYWPGESAIGKRIIRRSRSDHVYRTIVGVVDDVKDSTLWEQPAPVLYVPYYQGSFPSVYMIVVTSLAPESAKRAIESAIWSIDRNLPVSEFRPLDELSEESLSRPRFTASLITIFAALGLTLAAIGVYGSVSYSISQRKREIGIRMAVGSKPQQISSLLLRQGLPIALSGVGLAMAGTWLVQKWGAQIDYALGTNPLSEFGFSAIFILCIWCIASYVPAKRASKLDPVTMLRS